MTCWRKTFVLFVLLLLPLQSLAASLSAFTCYSGGTPHSSGTHNDEHGSPAGAHADHHGAPHQHDGDAGVDHSGHQNCHHVFSGMPAALAVDVRADLPAFQPSISLLSTLFVPERPQRPPRF